MKITIYELLGLVKDGKAPKTIKYEYLIYELTPERNDYYCKQAMRWFTNEINALGVLDNEIEIIEEVEILLDYINKLEESIKDITEKAYNQLKNENNFLSKRENKLQLIEQMFQSGVVDLSKLSKIVEDKC